MGVMYRDPVTGMWNGPAEVKYVGWGYMRVLTSTGTQWVPVRWTKAAPRPDGYHDHPDLVSDGSNNED